MAMKDPLAKLFGSTGRVKIMRLFLAHSGECLTALDVQRQTKTIKATVAKELRLLTQVGFLQKAKCTREEVKKLKTKEKVVTKTINGFALNTSFDYIASLRTLLTFVSADQGEALAKRVRKTGRIKVLIVGGVFLQDEKARVDILVVGDAIKHRMLESAVRAAEAELGQSLRYAVFSTDEFLYRYDMHDKLIRDIFDAPHNTLINRLSF